MACKITSGETVSSCENSLKAIQSYLSVENARRTDSAQQWNAYDNRIILYNTALRTWNTNKSDAFARITAGQTLSNAHIWHDNKAVDCNDQPTCQTCTNWGLLGTSCVKADCGASNCAVASKCNACGIDRCICSNFVAGTCASTRCGEYRHHSQFTFDPVMFPQSPFGQSVTQAQNTWNLRNPTPIAPVPPTIPKFHTFPWEPVPELICASCVQCMDLSNMTANQINMSDLQQKCINNLTVASSAPPTGGVVSPPTGGVVSPPTGGVSPPASETPTKPVVKNNTILFVIGGFILLFILIITIVLIIVLGGKRNSGYLGNSGYPQN